MEISDLLKMCKTEIDNREDLGMHGGKEEDSKSSPTQSGGQIWLAA